MTQPLSGLLRPSIIDDFVWQEKLVWKWKPLSTFLSWGKIPSMILWWPPWIWKTTFAYIISKKIKADFSRLSWVSSKKQDLEKIIERAKVNFRMMTPTIVFLDEIHRWNKAQQDALLPYVESWVLTLIWATTENPSFSVNNALLSRCRVFVFEKLSQDDIYNFFVKNLWKINQLYPDVILWEEVLKFISDFGNGDLRNSINILETAILSKSIWELTVDDIKSAIEKPLYYDKNWEEHYNIISAVHKSLRDSDADAACYWIQRMLVWWEDPLFILRRLIRFASEDIWLADNNALTFANNCYEAFQKVWLPEWDIIILQLAIYLAKAPKSNVIYMANYKIKDDIQKYWNLWVPFHIRNAPTDLMKDLGYGKWYKYAHDYDNASVEQEHFPDELKWRKYF